MLTKQLKTPIKIAFSAEAIIFKTDIIGKCWVPISKPNFLQN